MIKRIAPLLLAAIASSSAVAQDCDQAEAKARWEKAEANSIILGAGMVNDIPSFAVDERVWDDASLNTRTGMVTTFECLVAGPGNALGEAQVLNKGGEVLAVWNGVSQQLDFQ